MEKRFLKIIADNLELPELEHLKSIINKNFEGTIELIPLLEDESNTQIQHRLVEKLSFIRTVLDSTDELQVYAVDLDKQYQFFNQVHSKMIQKLYNVNLEIGSNALEVITTDVDKFRLDQSINLALSKISHKTVTKIDSEDTTLFIESFFSPLFNKKNEVVGVTIFSHNVRDRIQAEENLRISEERYSTIFEQSPIGIALIDSYTGDFIDINSNYAKICQRSIEELSRLSWVSITHPDDVHLDLNNMKLLNEGVIDKFVMNKRYITPDNKIIWVNMKVNPLGYLNDRKTHLAMIEDITERVENLEKIKHLSNHDYLTSLHNRRYFEQKIKEIDISENLPITIVLGDINGLKLLNDTFGHNVGDEALILIADILNKNLIYNEVLARVSGDEFSLILPNTNEISAKKRIKTIQEEISKQLVMDLEISVSFGHSTKSIEEVKISKTLKEAEENMYKNKLFESHSYRSRTITIISNTLFEKNPRELKHSERVGEICEKIGMFLELPMNDVKRLKLCGLMHDIGKIGINESILNKTGKLSSHEFRQVKKHPEIGFRILGSSSDFLDIANYVLSHHEKWDGNGYPKGLKGEEIPLQSRIISIADAFDAMTRTRTYRNTLSPKEAIEEIIRCSGTQFDPKLVDVFVKNIQI